MSRHGTVAFAVATAGLVLLLLGLSSLRSSPMSAPQVELPAASRRLSSGSGFVSNAADVRYFAWTKPTRTVLEALQDAFPNPGADFHDQTFEEARVPARAYCGVRSYQGTECDQDDRSEDGEWCSESQGNCENGCSGKWCTEEEYVAKYSWSRVVSWIDVELLNGDDPFKEQDGKVPVPWDATAEGDQLAPGQYVGYSRRQVCYIVAKSLVGAGLDGYDHGLKRFMFKTTECCNCEPQTGDFGKSWWGLLTACAADPTLKGGAQGPMLIVAKGRAGVDPQILMDASDHVPLADAGFQLCRYSDEKGTSEGLPGVPEVPKARCHPPDHSTAPGIDFMTVGGENGQAVQAMSGDLVGGNAYGTTCNMGGGQDSRLALFMPEVSALVFFLSKSGERPPQLGQPIWILGARMLFAGLDGTSRFSAQFHLDSKARLNSDLVNVSIGSSEFQMSTSKPFVAFKSFMQWNALDDGLDDFAVKAARKNQLKQQRNGGNMGNSTFRQLVAHWHRGVSLDFHDPDLHPLMKSVVKYIGAGPWAAGLAYGDSQLGLLAMWIGHALAATSWGGSGRVPLDYYLYSSYVENQGNQCLLHSWSACASCLKTCIDDKPPAGTWWAPSQAYMSYDKGNPCVIGGDGACPKNGLETIMWNFGLKHTGPLWRAVEEVLSKSDGDVSKSVFDLLMERDMDLRMEGLKPPVS